MVKCTYGLLFIFIFCTSSKGQTKTNLPIDTIKSESKKAITSHGPSTSVRTIKQDRKGNIWLASNEGVIRYDGKSFTNITANVSLYRFFSVLEDRKGNFWFGAYGSGVYYYDGKTLPTGQAGFQHFTTAQGLVNNQISTIYEDKAGNIWFGAWGGVSCYDARLRARAGSDGIDEVGQGKSFRNYIITGDSMMEDGTGK